MRTTVYILAGCAAAAAFAPSSRLRGPACHLRRAGSPRAEIPFKSDGGFDYFRIQREVTITLPKPLGAVLEETAPSGVKVTGLQEGGSALDTKLLKKNDRILTVMGQNVAAARFDDVMAALVAAPEEVELGVSRVVIVKRPAAPPPADPVLTIDGVAAPIDLGAIMRNPILASGTDMYKGIMAKAQQCGGLGQCSLCWVNVVSGEENLSPRTAVELKKGAKRPPTYRMSCQAIVNGDVAIEMPKK